MRAICEELQEAAGLEDLSRAPGLLDRLEEEFRRASGELREKAAAD